MALLGSRLAASGCAAPPRPLKYLRSVPRPPAAGQAGTVASVAAQPAGPRPWRRGFAKLAASMDKGAAELCCQSESNECVGCPWYGTGELGWQTLVAASHFVPVKPLGQGSNGHVYLAVDPCSGQEVAVKVLDKQRVLDSSSTCQRAALKREGDLLESMQGPNVVELLGLYEDDRFAYIAMEVCDLGDLQGFIDAHSGPIPESVVSALAFQMINVLANVNRSGICYSDIKPANFLLKSTGTPNGNGVGLEIKLADFGCSQEYSDEEFLTSRTGTPLYTAPEVYLGRYGVAADIWGLGMILFRMLSGQWPFRSNLNRISPSTMILAIMNDELSFEDEVWNGISNQARDLVARMLQRQVGRRITAEEAARHPWFVMHNQSNAQVTSNIEPFPSRLATLPVSR